MIKKSLLSLAVFVLVSAAFANDVKCGADKVNPDAECAASKTVCILAMDPPVCKAPLAKGSACLRDKVCASNKCSGANVEKKVKGKCE